MTKEPALVYIRAGYLGGNVFVRLLSGFCMAAIEIEDVGRIIKRMADAVDVVLREELPESYLFETDEVTEDLYFYSPHKVEFRGKEIDLNTIEEIGTGVNTANRGIN